MRIKNGNVFTAGSFQKMDLEFSRTITALGTLSGPGDLDAAGCYVIPGLVDIHTHGAVGEDFSDGKPQGLRPLADYYAAHGVTSFLATTMTLREHQLTPAMEAIRGWFGGEVEKRSALAQETKAQLDHAFAFLEETFGQGQELVIFVTELTAYPDTSWFVETFGCDAYFRHNRELLFDDTRHRIREEIAAAKAAQEARHD